MSSSQEGPVAELDARPRETPGGLAHLGLRIRLLAASARTSTSGRSAAGDTRGIVSGSRRSTCLKTRRPSRGPFRRRPSWADLTVPHPACRRGYGLGRVFGLYSGTTGSGLGGDLEERAHQLTGRRAVPGARSHGPPDQLTLRQHLPPSW